MNERLGAAARETIRREIAAADGNEVSFVATVSPDGIVTGARAVARGTVEMVLALPGVARRGEMLLHNHPSGRLEPSSADLSVAARAHDDGIGFGIVDNAGERLYVVVEVPQATETVRLDPFDVIDQLGERGPIARRLGSYEDRQSQRDLTAHLVDAYNDGGVLLLEAGTGVGKSFAYLVPALAWARANNERTIVSTNTINLQEQLVGKDLPLLAEALGTPEWTPTFALLKGWRNYLCRARLEVAAASQQSLLEGEKLDELLNLVAWAAHTADGSLADLPVPPSGEVWDEVSAEGDLCPRIRCRHFDRCFVFQARRHAAQADIVVVNHHLLASDLAVRQASDNWEEAAVLPAWKRLILDEAHHLEDVAAGHLGRQVSSRGIRRILGRLERNGKGLVPSLQRDLATADDLLSRASLDLVRERLIPAVGEARRAAEQLVLRLFGVLEEAGLQQLRFDDDFARHPAWDEGLRAELTRRCAPSGQWPSRSRQSPTAWRRSSSRSDGCSCSMNAAACCAGSNRRAMRSTPRSGPPPVVRPRCAGWSGPGRRARRCSWRRYRSTSRPSFASCSSSAPPRWGSPPRHSRPAGTSRSLPRGSASPARARR